MKAAWAALRAALAKVRQADGTKERNIAFAEVSEAAQRIENALTKNVENEVIYEVRKMLGALRKGSMFPGMRNYIKHPAEFDAAIERLRLLVGDVEEIEL